MIHPPAQLFAGGVTGAATLGFLEGKSFAMPRRCSTSFELFAFTSTSPTFRRTFRPKRAPTHATATALTPLTKAVPLLKINSPSGPPPPVTESIVKARWYAYFICALYLLSSFWYSALNGGASSEARSKHKIALDSSVMRCSICSIKTSHLKNDGTPRKGLSLFGERPVSTETFMQTVQAGQDASESVGIHFPVCQGETGCRHVQRRCVGESGPWATSFMQKLPKSILLPAPTVKIKIYG